MQTVDGQKKRDHGKMLSVIAIMGHMAKIIKSPYLGPAYERRLSFSFS